MNPTSAAKTRIESEIAALRRRKENLLEQVDSLSARIHSLKAELQAINLDNPGTGLPAPESQAPELCRVLKEDPDPEVRRRAAEAIGALFSESPALDRIPTEAKAPKTALKEYH